MTKAEIIAAAREIVSRPTMYYPDGVQMNIARELIRLHDGGTWSSTPPTEPGWYWWKGFEDDEPLFLEISETNGELAVVGNPSVPLDDFLRMQVDNFWLRAEPADAAALAELLAENERLRKERDDWENLETEVQFRLQHSERELAAAKAEREAAIASVDGVDVRDIDQRDNANADELRAKLLGAGIQLAAAKAEVERLKPAADELDKALDEWHKALSRAESSEAELAAARAELAKHGRIFDALLDR